MEKKINMSSQEIYTRFPFFVDIHGWKILVIGGGSISARRVGVLQNFGPEITVVGRSLTTELEDLRQCGCIQWVQDHYSEELMDRDHWNLVLTATDDPDVNRRVTKAARDRGIPVNNASDQTDCDFFFPAIVRGSGMIMGMVSDGSDHHAVRRVAAQIRREYGDKEE